MSRTDFPEQLDRRYEPPRRQIVREPPGRRGPDRRMMGGIAAAVALGLVGGFLMKPNLDDQAPAKAANARKVEVPTEPDGLDIVVDTRPPPLEPVTPLAPASAPYTAPMEGFTPQPIPAAPRPQPAPTPVSRPAPAPARPAPAPREDGAVLRPYSEVVRQPARVARPSFNCRYARTTSERMVCQDPNLAAADRRLARAYSEAIDAGVPERMLRRQQDIWLNAREGAARYGPQDVERVYEARIAELQQMGR